MGHGKQPDESWADYNYRASMSSDPDDRMQFDEGGDEDGGGGYILVVLFLLVGLVLLFTCR